jgi:trehalose 6-phosphate phosphatase
VRVDGRLLALLERVREASRGAVALISGRSVADVDGLFSPLVLPIAGQHGIERRDAGGAISRHAPPRASLAGAATATARLAAGHAGLVFEDKGLSLALHYRQAPTLRALVEREMRSVAADLGGAFELQSGKYVMEIKPSGRDKGMAIAEFNREPPFAGRCPVFIGDDLTDEPGFEYVNRAGGHSVKVGPGITQARWRLADAAAVSRWLEDFATHCVAAARARPEERPPS